MEFSSTANTKQHISHPWRRYFARMLDVSIYIMIWLILLALIFNINIMNRSGLLNYLDLAIAIVTMLFLEPLLLRYFGTTIGKRVFGLYLKYENGGNPSYSSGFNRTMLVLKYGMGYQIPFYNIYRLWQSYKTCKNQEDLEWDDELIYSIKDTKLYRSFIFLFINTLIIVLAIMANTFAQLPLNRGDLTISEFAENYNKLSSYYKIETSKYLNENGIWVDKPLDGMVYIDVFNTPLARLEFTTENNYINSISYEIEINNSEDLIYPSDNQIILTAFSFIGAQKEVGIFGNIYNTIIELISEDSYNDFSHTIAGIQINRQIELSGYEYMNPGQKVLIPKEGEDKYYHLVFTMEKN